MELFVEMHMQSEDRQKKCNNSSTVELNTSWYIGFQPFFYVIIFLNLMI